MYSYDKFVLYVCVYIYIVKQIIISIQILTLFVCNIKYIFINLQYI